MYEIEQLAEQYSYMISQLPGLFLLKSCDSKYVGFSQQFSSLLGWKNQQECIGRSDADLPCPAAELAEVFIKEDQETLLLGETKQLHLTKYCDDAIKIFITNKKIFIDQDGNTIGLIVYDEDVTHHPEVQKMAVNEMIKMRAYSSSSHRQGLKMKITSSYAGFNLSVRESEILYYLIRNENPKTISIIFNIATRTVEKHTQNIMEKLGCYSRKQLIEFANDKNMINVLLNSLFVKSFTLKI